VPRQIAIVPHTHWDREWYRPFQTFRLRLVDVLDGLLPRLADGSAGDHFMLDGQMAAVDDYLEVRPEAEGAIRQLVTDGRLAIGPWYVLMDEFCVSGETMVRDLQLGMEKADALGGHMHVGYLPDMFGHVAQMPQLLRLAGFEHTVVWRGVPKAIDRTAFWWRAPDGSQVRAEYLPVGYGNGAAIPDDAQGLLRRIRAHETELGSALLDGMLVLNGSDHATPQPWLVRVVSDANTAQQDYALRITSLLEYLDAAPTEGLPTWTGELRSGARANLLMGVLSNRVDVKQAAARAERELERLAEPLSALFLPVSDWPQRLLDMAWTDMIRNAAHDSSCACSVDEVVDAVLHRYAEARQVAEGLTRRALRSIAASMRDPGAVVINPTAKPRAGTVELVLPGNGPVEGAQLLTEGVAGVREVTSVCRELEAVLVDIYDAAPDGGGLSSVDVEEDDNGISVSLRLGPHPGNASMAAVVGELFARAGARPDDPLTVRIEHEPFRRIVSRTAPVPGFGWWTWEPLNGAAPVLVDDRALDNGLVRVEVDDRGELTINGIGGMNRLVDDGDFGDTYNYSPPEGDVVVDEPINIAVDVLERGPVRGRIRITRRYGWPESIVAGERVGRRDVVVTSDVEVHADESVVRIETSLDNVVKDHRLRAWFPLATAATASTAECAFATVERGLTAEGGPHEHGLPTFPSRRFVSAAGVTVLHEGLLEYELVDEGRSLALTLFRSIGMLSRPHMTYRSRPAGPSVPAEGAQVQGRRTLRYAVAVGDDVDPYALVDDVFVPLDVVTGLGGGDRPSTGAALTVDGAEVSAVLRNGDGYALEVRVFNPTDRETTVSIAGRRGTLVDLTGTELGTFDGAFTLRPYGIATARVTD
jgi:hypothetical protein